MYSKSARYGLYCILYVGFLISLLVKRKTILLLQSCKFCLLYPLNNFRRLKTIKHSYTRSTLLDVNRTRAAYYLKKFIRFIYSFSVVFLCCKQKQLLNRNENNDLNKQKFVVRTMKSKFQSVYMIMYILICIPVIRLNTI